MKNKEALVCEAMAQQYQARKAALLAQQKSAKIDAALSHAGAIITLMAQRHFDALVFLAFSTPNDTDEGVR